MQRQGARRFGRLGAAPARGTAPAVLLAKAHLDVGGARGVDPLGPARRGVPLGTVHLLALPIHDEVGQRVRPLDFGLPVGIRARRAPQRDALVIAAADEQLCSDIGRVDQVLARCHVLVDESLLDGGRALRLMDAGRGRVDVREEVRGGGLARFADVHHGAGPLGVPLVAVARVGIVGRLDALGGRRQCTIRLEPHAALTASPFHHGLVLRPFLVTLPRPTQALQDR